MSDEQNQILRSPQINSVDINSVDISSIDINEINIQPIDINPIYNDDVNYNAIFIAQIIGIFICIMLYILQEYYSNVFEGYFVIFSIAKVFFNVTF